MNDVPKDRSKPAQVWNALFDGPGYLFGTQPNDYLVEKKACLKKGQKVLFVADGEGRNSVWCAAELGIQADAFDLSEKAVAKEE